MLVPGNCLLRYLGGSGHESYIFPLFVPRERERENGIKEIWHKISTVAPLAYGLHSTFFQVSYRLEICNIVNLGPLAIENVSWKSGG